MNRTNYFNYIEEKLSTLAYRINLRGKLNVLDFHLHSENFYQHFFNKLFGWNLKNINVVKQNMEAIDLIDDQMQTIIQVSATNSKTKVESALQKDLSKYSGFSFKFISIAKSAGDLRKCNFSNPYNLTFDPSSDIYDTKSILDHIIVLDIDEQRHIYKFIKNELGNDYDEAKIETNLATVINILAKENWDLNTGQYQTKPFDIEKKISFNNLDSAKVIIDDYIAHSNRVNNIYTEFNKQGVNKSTSVLSSIKKIYVENMGRFKNNDDLFFKIIELIMDKIQKSSNYCTIPTDELELCANILVVDAFIRCKIFENPEGYIYVTT